MRSTKGQMRLLLPLLFAITASGCGGAGTTRPAFPPAADIKQAVEPKPAPTVDILTSDQASEDYNAAIEGWGDRGHKAGARLCRWFERAGMKLPFKCPPRLSDDPGL